jgi:formylglycine-generating enzyme required for sulfatase activity
VSGFRLDEYLVTVGRFRLFTAAWNAGYRPAVGSGRHTHLNADAGLVAVGDAGTAHESGWIAAYAGQLSPTDEDLACDPAFATWTAQPGAHESLPINCVNWYEAYAFCIWDGGFLPSEAEWEYTAVGGSEQRTYPWGSTPPGTESQYAICGCYYGGSGSCSGVTSIAPVGTPDAGTGLWGQRDLAGELSEWNLDGYFASYVEPCDDCAYLGATTERVIRGGGFDSSGALLVSATRDASDPAARVKDVGVRCARVP